MHERPAVLLLDVNQTLTDMAPLAARLERVGAPRHLLDTWFAATLRDGIALSAAGAYAPFADVARAALTTLLASEGMSGDSASAAETVVAGMGELPLHPDIVPGLKRLRELKFRVVPFTNGSAETTRQVLERGGAGSLVEECLSVAGAQRWKPAPQSYRYACEHCGVSEGQAMLVAVHPWDVDGAKRAGLSAAWIDRRGEPYPEPFTRADLHARSFVALADALASA